MNLNQNIMQKLGFDAIYVVVHHAVASQSNSMYNSSIDCVAIFVIRYFLQLHVTGIYLCITKVIWKSLLWQGGNIKSEELYFICVIHCTGLGEDEAENLPYKQSEEKANLEKLLILHVIKSKISRKNGWWGLGWEFPDFLSKLFLPNLYI